MTDNRTMLELLESWRNAEVLVRAALTAIFNAIKEQAK